VLDRADVAVLGARDADELAAYGQSSLAGEVLLLSHADRVPEKSWRYSSPDGSGLGGRRLLVDTQLMDVQAGYLELLDLQTADDCPTDRQTANRQGADSARPDCRRPDRGCADASRLELNQSTLPRAQAELWEETRRLSPIVHDLVLLRPADR
jgi:hypothetical protein